MRWTLWTLPLALLASIVCAPVFSQSTPANATPTEHKADTGQAATAPQMSAPASPDEIRQAQIEADTRKLYRLAAELRAEVAKTYKESLSLTVLKKAAEIEDLSRELKARMDEEAASAKHKKR